MNPSTRLNRRDFIKSSALMGGGLLLSISLSTQAKQLSSSIGLTLEFVPNAFLRIGEDNSIRIILSKVEMGQGVWITLPLLLAEELDCDWNTIKIEHSLPGKDYADTVYGQSTGGSSSTWVEFDRYRQAGAVARTMLIEAAANRLGVSSANCRTENGFVIAGTKRISYGRVASEAAKLPVPTVQLREAKDWKYIGKGIKRLDSPAKINGQAKFGLDIQFSGLLTAVVAHAPVFGGKVISFNAIQAKAIPGVRAVVQIPTGVAVIADHYWAAKLGRDALTINWNLGPNENINSDLQLEEYLALTRTKGMTSQQKGDVATALSKAFRIIETEHSVPYSGYAPMEPLNCTVRLNSDSCELWVGNQSPLLYQSIVASVLGFKAEQVTIHTPFIGGSFGRRGSFDADWVIEAVHIARVSGKFIKLIWSREDDIRGGYYRPIYLHRAIVGIGQNGLPLAWEHHVVGQSLFTNTPLGDSIVVNGIDYSSIDGVNESPYLSAIPDHAVNLHTTYGGVPILPWRSVGNTHTCFVMETLIDELAALTGSDPVEYRRRLLKDHPRHLATLNLAAEKADWDKPLLSGRYRGIAVHAAMGSYVAQVVELSIIQQKLSIHRVVCAIDCGLAVNPDGVRAQMEGGIVFGLTAALYGEITLTQGRVERSNFHDYRMLRMSEMPRVEVHLVPSTGRMGGAGEPGVPPIAPALVNALFAATQKRIRKLPIQIKDLGTP